MRTLYFFPKLSFLLPFLFLSFPFFTSSTMHTPSQGRQFLKLVSYSFSATLSAVFPCFFYLHPFPSAFFLPFLFIVIHAHVIRGSAGPCAPPATSFVTSLPSSTSSAEWTSCALFLAAAGGCRPKFLRLVLVSLRSGSPSLPWWRS